MTKAAVSNHVEDAVVGKEEIIDAHYVLSKDVGKEHGGEESYDGDEDGEEEGECTLALDCGERHETGDEWEFHVLGMIVLCVNFAVSGCIFDIKFAV